LEREKEQVREWESAQLLMSLGVGEKLVKICSGNYYELMKNGGADKLGDKQKLEEFKEGEDSRLKKIYASEKERVGQFVINFNSEFEEQVSE